MKKYVNNTYNNYNLSEGEQSTETYRDAKISVKKIDIDNSIPSGGFPPIYQCDSQKLDQKVNIEYKKAYYIDKDIVSIKDIMEARRKK